MTMAQDGEFRHEVVRAMELLKLQRFGEARTAAAHALALAGDEPAEVLPAAYAAGEVERLLGDPARALPYFTRALVASQVLPTRDRDALLRAATCHLAWAAVAALLPEILPEAVLEVLAAADAFAARADDSRLRARIALATARQKQMAGDDAGALHDAYDGVAWLRGGIDGEAALLFAQAAELALEAGDPERGAEWLSSAWGGVDSSPQVSVAVLVGLARLALARGRPDDALEQARLAVAKAEGLGAQARLAAWAARADCARAVGIRSEAAAAGWRVLLLSRERGARDAVALGATLCAIDAWLHAEDWEAVEAILPDAAALAGALDATRGGTAHLRKVTERRARWFVNRCTIDATDLRIPA